MNTLDRLLADYENLCGGGMPELDRARKRDTKAVRQAFEAMRFVCERLIAVEQPNPRRRCTYCNGKPHESFCVVAVAQNAIKLLRAA